MRVALDALSDLLSTISLDDFRTKPLPELISSSYIDILLQAAASIGSRGEAQRIINDRLEGLAATLFLATGKSDNNAKCQFPLYLRRHLGMETLPTFKLRKGAIQIQSKTIPRVLKSPDYLSCIGTMLGFASKDQIADFSIQARVLLGRYVAFILADSNSREQLWCIARSYHALRADGLNAEMLLAPLITFQVRGSVSASGGHEPEELLRTRMEEWGLERDIDFNVSDVVLDVEAGTIHEESPAEYAKSEDEGAPQTSKKTRAYDFVLPFRSNGWTPRIFIQSQFYAGDSGSVSHKNVDQTSTSRRNATALLAKAWPNSPAPRFLEYVDGAGYYASLNRDLKSLLSLEDTKSFFQLRSSSIRLRREFQDVGFLTLLELEHSLLVFGCFDEARKNLRNEGYENSEIERCVASAVKRGLVCMDSDGDIALQSDRCALAKRYLLLDLIVKNGKEFSGPNDLVGVVLVPGYGPYFGTECSALGKVISGSHGSIWPDVATYNNDLTWLCKIGFALQR